MSSLTARSRLRVVLALAFVAVLPLAWLMLDQWERHRALDRNASPMDLARAATKGNSGALRRLTEMAPKLPADERQRLVSLLRMLGADAAPFMCSALEAGIPSLDRRATALRIVGVASKTAEAEQVVLKHLEDPDIEAVRPTAIEIAGRWRLRQAVPSLLKQFEQAQAYLGLTLRGEGDGDQVVPSHLLPPRNDIVKALCEIGDPAALPAIESFLREVSPASEWGRRCRSAIRAMKGQAAIPGRARPTPRRRLPETIQIDGQELSVTKALPELVRRFLSAKKEARTQAVVGLFQIGPRLGGTAQYDQLKTCFETSSDRSLRMEALRVLTFAGGEQAQGLLQRAAVDADLVVRQFAQRLQKEPMPRVYAPGAPPGASPTNGEEQALLMKLRSQDIDERLQALDRVEVLDPTLRGGPVVKELERLFRESSDTAARARVLRIILTVQGRAAQGLHEQALADPDRRIRIEANALSRLVGRKPRPLMEVMQGRVRPLAQD